MSDRWPPIYDASSLADTIDEIVERDDFSGFYDSVRNDPKVCQGDVIRLDSGIPLISENGEPIADDAAEYWLVIGNTCDFERDRAAARWTQLVPIIDLGTDLISEKRTSIQRYQTSRAFFVPSWKLEVERSFFIADFLRPVTADKAVFDEAASVEARLTRLGWILLHSCLVRFLCRDDRRFA